MNKARRKRIDDVIRKLEELKDEVDSIRYDEQEAYDNLPEGIQMSDRGDEMQSAVDSLDYAYDGFDDIIDNLNEALEH